MADFADFKEYYSLAAKLVNEVSKEQVAECARMLALHLADYVQRFGDLPRNDALSLLGVTEIDDKRAALLSEGMQILVGYLAVVRDQPSEGAGGAGALICSLSHKRRRSIPCAQTLLIGEVSITLQ